LLVADVMKSHPHLPCALMCCALRSGIVKELPFINHVRADGFDLDETRQGTHAPVLYPKEMVAITGMRLLLL
jgi:hypothetical protein